MREQKLITKCDANADRPHFLQAPGSIGSLQSLLDDGWLFIKSWQEKSSVNEFITETFLFERDAQSLYRSQRDHEREHHRKIMRSDFR